MYSQSKGSVFCLMCKLFEIPNGVSPFATHGFGDWKRAEEKARVHEDRVDHRNAVVAWLDRSTVCDRIDKELVCHFVTQSAYCKELLKRVVAVIILLAKRGLSLRGSEEVFGSP